MIENTKVGNQSSQKKKRLTKEEKRERIISMYNKIKTEESKELRKKRNRILINYSLAMMVFNNMTISDLEVEANKYLEYQKQKRLKR